MFRTFAYFARFDDKEVLAYVYGIFFGSEKLDNLSGFRRVHGHVDLG